jgi:hypothetical protein
MTANIEHWDHDQLVWGEFWGVDDGEQPFAFFPTRLLAECFVNILNCAENSAPDVVLRSAVNLFRDSLNVSNEEACLRAVQKEFGGELDDSNKDDIKLVLNGVQYQCAETLESVDEQLSPKQYQFHIVDADGGSDEFSMTDGVIKTVEIFRQYVNR